MSILSEQNITSAASRVAVLYSSSLTDDTNESYVEFNGFTYHPPGLSLSSRPSAPIGMGGTALATAGQGSYGGGPGYSLRNSTNTAPQTFMGSVASEIDARQKDAGSGEGWGTGVADKMRETFTKLNNGNRSLKNALWGLGGAQASGGGIAGYTPQVPYKISNRYLDGSGLVGSPNDWGKEVDANHKWNFDNSGDSAGKIDFFDFFAVIDGDYQGDEDRPGSVAQAWEFVIGGGLEEIASKTYVDNTGLRALPGMKNESYAEMKVSAFEAGTGTLAKLIGDVAQMKANESAR